MHVFDINDMVAHTHTAQALVLHLFAAAHYMNSDKHVISPTIAGKREDDDRRARRRSCVYGNPCVPLARRVFAVSVHLAAETNMCAQLSRLLARDLRETKGHP